MADKSIPKNKRTEPPGVQRTKANKVLLFIIVLLSLTGVGVSIELTRIHYLTHTDPSFSSICAISEKINCETVARSPYSVMLEIPVSVWGILGNLMMAIMGIWGLVDNSNKRWPHGILLGLFLVSAVWSAVMWYISISRIDSLCIYCVSLYVNCGVLLAIGVLLVLVNRSNPLQLVFQDIKRLMSMPKVTFSLVAAGLITVAALYFGLPKYWTDTSWAELPRLPMGMDAQDHHWIGAKEPVITVEEFSDYECPHCRNAHKKARMAIAKYGDKVRLIHRHFPLDDACNPIVKRPHHQRACEFSQAVECAAEQGSSAFWKMNDAVFGAQDNTRSGNIDVHMLAVEAGIDIKPFVECMESGRTMSKIKKDLKAATDRNLTGTPTFYIGSRSYPGNLPVSALKQILDAKTATDNPS